MPPTSATDAASSLQFEVGLLYSLPGETVARIMSNATDTRSTKVDQTILSAAGHAAPSVEEEQVHFLVAQNGSSPGLRIEIKTEPVTLGRTEASHVQVADPRVSKKHCELQLVENRVVVKDLESTNGTLIDLLRVQGTMPLPVGARLRIGDQIFLHELRSRREVQKTKELETELQNARAYVQALLPPPRTEGAVRTDWSFIPCSLLGGDAFGYHDLDPDHIAFYLLDVCGHGAGAAMHSVTVINTLRHQALPGIDFTQPGQVLRGLNTAYDMDQHNGMYFTFWYGVYDRRTRTLVYASAGHPPALLVGPDRQTAATLQTKSMAIGMMPGQNYQTGEIHVTPGSNLYLFSDGVFEIVTKEQKDWDFAGFRNLILQPRTPSLSESARLQQAVENLSLTKALADDFSLLVAEWT